MVWLVVTTEATPTCPVANVASVACAAQKLGSAVPVGHHFARRVVPWTWKRIV